MRKPSLISALFIVSIFVFSCQNKTSNPEGQLIIPNGSVITPAVSETQNTVQQPVQANTNVASKGNRTDGVQAYLARFEPKAQQFSIQPAIENTLHCSEGATIKFPADCFTYSNGVTVEGTVNVEVKEFLDKADFILSGLITSSYDKMLESAGMVYISADANGIPVQIKAGEVYEIDLPAEKQKNGMELFYGNSNADGSVNWLSANGINASLGGFKGKQYIRSPRFEGGYEGMYQYLNRMVTIPDGLKNKELVAHMSVYVTLNYYGEVTKVKQGNQVQTYLDKEIIAAIKGMPCWEVPSSTKLHDAVQMHLNINANFIRDPSLLPIRERLVDRAENIKYVASYVMDNYVVPSSRLGWINCDRFITADPKTDLFVSTKEGEGTDVKIVFDQINSVMRGIKMEGGYLFKDIPENEPVTVLALKVTDTSVQLAVKRATTCDENIQDLVFTNVSDGALKNIVENITSGKAGDLAFLNY